MNIISLEEAASHIKQAITGAKSQKERLPFFFIVGAGISYPPIPLAAKIEDDFRKIAFKHGRTSPSEKIDDPLVSYSHWAKQAYANPIQRQAYLRKLMEKKPISHANFRLAHLLEKKIATMVITPNFDDFLSRALRLFGKEPLVCDHPRTVDRIHPERDDLQIVHVHGTYWFYDCCNLSDEVEDRALPDSHSTLTMATLLWPAPYFSTTRK
ncbi:SIR2 family protein [Candidatus Acetothermia bacterium]|nr:SIR2 family protein [Candidatus Acetothermia bacterium]MBI3642674.1 SIR2 family protein [Candidatus Acetothermia bacterium]